MRQTAILFVMVLIIAACIVGVLLTPSSALEANTGAAALETQQQEAYLRVAMIDETAQAQSAANDLAQAAAAADQARIVAQANLDRQAADAIESQATSDALVILQAQQHIQATATAQAMVYQQTAQAIEAKATANSREILLAQQQSQMSATAQALAEQQTVQAIEANATVDARAALLAQENKQFISTVEAMQREKVKAEQWAAVTRRLGQLVTLLILIAAAGIVGLAALLGMYVINGLVDAANENRALGDQRYILLGSPTQKNAYVKILQTEPARLRLLNPPSRLLFKPNNGSSFNHTPAVDMEIPPALIDLTFSDKLLADRAEVGGEVEQSRLVMKLLRDAIAHDGTQFDHIASAAQLGWPARAWATAVAILKPYGVEILLGMNGGPRLGWRYPTLQALQTAFSARRFAPILPRRNALPNVETSLKGK